MASQAVANKRDASSARKSGERVLALDVLRGIAILGTLASNIWIFTAVAQTNDRWLETFAQWFPNGKFLGLLTIMFGIGLEIQRQSALRAGRSWPGKYPIRALILFADGALNYIFVVNFDVLRAYAVVGLLVAFLLLTSERVQWWLIGLFLSVHLSVMTWQAMNGDEGGDRRLSTGARGDVGDQAFGGGAGTFDPNAGLGWWDSSMDNLQSFFVGFGFRAEFFTILLMGLGLFLLGAKLYRIGLFAPERTRLRWAVMAGGFGIALPLDYLLGVTSVFPSQWQSFARYGAAPGVALGILALVAEFYTRRPEVGRVGKVMSTVGRMALSCYLLQNIIGVVGQYTVFRWSAFTQLDPLVGTTLAFVGISVILVIFSWAWLSKFQRGPFELVWNWMYRVLAREKRVRA